MIDLRIIGGTVIDGTGAPSRVVDIAVDAGRIVTIGPPGSLPEAVRTIDATGRIVTPGFIDPHTHMDAQLWWAPTGAPSVLHGVTSVVVGSCGFGIAPRSGDDDEYVLRSLESVEEIPYEVTRRGVPMSWLGWADYFERLGALPLGVNVAGFVPHSALRTGVLGAAGRGGALDAAQRDQLRGALREALDVGAVGLSTSRGSNHTDALGAPMPSRLADDTELRELLELCGDRTWQINIASKGDRSEAGVRRAAEELATYDAWSQAVGARVTWTPLVVGPGDQVAWRRLLAFAEEHQAHSVPQVCAQPVLSAISFDGPSFAALIDGWAEAFAGYGDLSDDLRRERLTSSAFRDMLRASPENPERVTAPAFDRWRVIVSPSDAGVIGRTIRSIATDRGVDAVDVMCDLALADRLATVIEAPLSNLDPDALQELVTADSTMLGLGDAGAHIKSITNYTYPTTVVADLAHRRGWMSLERAVQQITSRPAEVCRLEGRGVLSEGAPADVNVIDLDHLAVGPAEIVADLPGGGRRLHCSATGYDAVIVNGTVVVDHDELRPAPVGQLLRVRS